MRFPFFLLTIVLKVEITQALQCDEDTSALFVRNIDAAAFSYWYSSIERFTISINAQLKSSSTNGTRYVLKFETISFKVTYYVSLCYT